MLKKNLTRALMCAAIGFGGTTANAKDLAFSIFVPAASPTVSRVFQPWADWFNEQTAGEDVSVKLFAGGSLGRNPKAQAQMVADGVADMAITVPSYTPGVYPDYDIFELPGFATTVEEGSEAVSELQASGALRGYEDYYVVALYTSGAYMLHSSKPINGFDDIAGQKFRVAGQIQTAVVEAIGGVAVDMSATQMAENIDRGLIDGAMSDASVAKTFRVADVAPNHFNANLGVLVFAIIMNKDAYEGLSDKAKEVLAQSGDYIRSKQYEFYGPAIEANLAAWDASADHTLVMPSEQDKARITEAVAPVIETVAGNVSPGLVDAYRAKIEEIRSR